MNVRHKYEYSVDIQAETAAAKVVRMVGQNRRTLEIGAGPGSISRLLKEYGNCRITAIELDETAIEKLSSFCEKVYQCDLNDPSWTQVVSEGGKFDVVVAADVLEHLYDPWATLSAMGSILNQDGYVVISLPHVGHSAVVGCLINADFRYQEWGLLDRTHIRFFGIQNIQKLFEQAGLKIIDAEFVVKNPEETEFAHLWRKLSSPLRQELDKNKYGTVYQVVVKAVPATALGKALNLTDLDVPSTAFDAVQYHSFKSQLRHLPRKIARRFLSMKTRYRIAQILDRLGIKY